MAAAGSATAQHRGGGRVQVVVVNWRSDANGNVVADLGIALDGFALSVVTRPEGGATPTDLYDIQMIDEFGFDILAGFGANRSDTTQEDQGLDIEWVSDRPIRTQSLRLEISNAGADKGGVTALYFSESRHGQSNR